MLKLALKKSQRVGKINIKLNIVLNIWKEILITILLIKFNRNRYYIAA